MLSNRAKLAITLGGGVTLAYAVTLWMNWPRPYWAGFAVAMISLSTFGESVFKGLQRLAGTVVAVVVALALIAWFSQERWMFALMLSLWICFGVWRMQVDSKHYYFWYCCAFIVPLLCLMSGFDSAQSFYVVEARAKETILGVLCFLAVALLISPASSTLKFKDQVVKHLDLVVARLGDVRARLGGADRSKDAGSRIGEIARGVMELPPLLVSAGLESFALRERATAWQQVCGLLPEIVSAIDQLDLSFDNLASSLQPDDAARIAAALDEAEARLLNARALLVGSAEVRAPLHIAHGETARTGDPFSQGAALLRSATLARLDDETKALVAAAADIADKGRVAARDFAALPRTIIPDPEMLAVVCFQFIVFWLAFLTYVYVPALPDAPIVVVMSGTLGLNIARMPWTPATKLLMPVVLATTYGAIAHIFIMPHLTSFVGLGTMLFLMVFSIGWIFHTDALQAGRFLSIAMFLLTLQISNENQAYSATYAFNMVVALVVVILEIKLVQRIPISFRPEDVVLRLLRRYGHSLVAVFDEMKWDRPANTTWYARQVRAYHLNQIATLPPRIAIWLSKVPADATSDADRNALNGLTTRLAALSLRIRDLVELRQRRSDGAWIALLREDVRAWRLGIQDVIRQLVDDARDIDPVELEQRLDKRLADLEAIIAAAAASGADSDATIEGTAHMHRVLSAYRGISFAILDVARTARGVAWDRLVEPRF